MLLAVLLQATDYMYGVDNYEEDLSEPVAPDSVSAVSAMLEKVSEQLRGRLNQLTEYVRQRCERHIVIEHDTLLSTTS